MPTRRVPKRLLEQAEERIGRAARAALTAYLNQARDALLYGHTPTSGTQVAADASPADLPPNLDAWPDSDVWAELVRTHLAPAIGAAFDQAWDAAARSDLNQTHRYRQTFMDEVFDRLSLGLWSDGTFDRIRGDLAEALDAGDSITRMRERISDQLQVDQHSYLADRIARTESHTATEGGAWSSARAWQDETGEVLMHQWIATADERTRPTHAAASGQRVPLDEPFSVGGASLQYPGDPSGPAEENINCRCSTLTGTEAELDDLPASDADQLQGSAMPTNTNNTPAEPEPGQQQDQALSGHWEGILAPLGVRGDFRILAAPADGAVLTSDHMWLSWQEHADGGHDGKVAVGVIDHVWVDGGNLHGRGRFDMGDELAAGVARKVNEGFAGTVSVDTTDLIDATVEYGIYDRDDTPVDTSGMDFFELMEALESGDLRELAVISNWRLGGATLVQDPAFHTGRADRGSAFIRSTPAPTEDEAGATTASAVEPDPVDTEQEERVATITAAAGIAPESTTWAERVAEVAPMEPPSEWFTNPNLTGPTKVRVTDSGRVYGHIACWDTSHIGFTGQQVRPPRSRTSYAHYRRHRVRCADGSAILTGTIVMGTGHADLYMTSSTAMDHYDHTGYNVADVAVGEDRYGIWFSGALKPGVSALQVLTLDRYSLSGDWRNGELVGVCVVNVPGFPIPEGQSELALAASGARMPTPRTQVRTVDGDSAALVASGVVSMTRTARTETAGAGRGEASIVQAMQAFQSWMERFDERLDQAITSAATNAARSLREEPEIHSLAHQVNAPSVEEAARMVNATPKEQGK